MALPKTEAKTVEERRDEIVDARHEDSYTRIENYHSYDVFPQLEPHEKKPQNIRFFPDGVEALVSVQDSQKGLSSGSLVDTTFRFLLIDQGRKMILEYSIDAPKSEF